MAASRLIARLREHNWVAAIIELAIVVLGILIALQVSNWNQDRQDGVRADSYYRRIHSDLLADGRNMGVILAFWSQVSAYGGAAIAYGETGRRVGDSDWKTVLAFYQASQTMPFEASDASFTEMRSAGALELIADENLRQRLEDYYSLSGVGGQSIIRQQDPIYRKEVRGLTPWPVQQYIWSHCFSEASYMTQQFVDCPSPVSAQTAADILTAFRSSPTLLNQLRTWMSTLGISEIVLTNSRRDAAKLAAEVTARRSDGQPLQ
ncbi:MAG TPA: hypothetical protein VFI32_02075 [Rhodanobacteraceae bacterium]|nr:hypothetical protein [Rhodanobacteraceae bacterium]